MTFDVSVAPMVDALGSQQQGEMGTNWCGNWGGDWLFEDQERTDVDALLQTSSGRAFSQYPSPCSAPRSSDFVSTPSSGIRLQEHLHPGGFPSVCFSASSAGSNVQPITSPNHHNRQWTWPTPAGLDLGVTDTGIYGDSIWTRADETMVPHVIDPTCSSAAGAILRSHSRLCTSAVSSPSDPAWCPMHSLKRVRESGEHINQDSSTKRRLSFSTVPASGDNLTRTPRPPSDISEEENLLLKLKQGQSTSWRDIAKEFETRYGRPHQVPALQMRYKRLRERLRPWTQEDVAALEAAHNYWQSNKFEIISQKMLEHGIKERWASKYCERKWQQLHPDCGKIEQSSTMVDQTKRDDLDGNDPLRARQLPQDGCETSTTPTSLPSGSVNRPWDETEPMQPPILQSSTLR